MPLCHGTCRTAVATGRANSQRGSLSIPAHTIAQQVAQCLMRNLTCTMYVSCSHINPSVENRTNKAPEKGTIVNPKMNVNLNRSTTMSCMMSKSGPSVGIKN
eukprot:969036-Prymnesium_polylepis.1